MDTKRILSVQPLINSQCGNFWCFTVVRNIESTSCQELFDNSEFWSRRWNGWRTMKRRTKRTGSRSLCLFFIYYSYFCSSSFVIIIICTVGGLRLASDTRSSPLKDDTDSDERIGLICRLFSQYLTRGLVAEPLQFTLLIQCSFVGDQHHWKY